MLSFPVILFTGQYVITVEAGEERPKIDCRPYYT